MTRPTQGTGGPDGRPRCFNAEPMREYDANNGTKIVVVNNRAVQAVSLKRSPWPFSQECKSWAGHKGTPPVPLIEGWKCEGCKHFPAKLFAEAMLAHAPLKVLDLVIENTELPTEPRP